MECTATTGSIYNGASSSAAYFPDAGAGNENPSATIIKNCEFSANDVNALSMRDNVTYAGKFTDCVGGKRAFGGSGTASGTFTNCVGGEESFGHTASGVFSNCTAGDNSFGGDEASGTFTNCTAGNKSFCWKYCTASGTFINCIAESNSFAAEAAPTGTFINCKGGNGSFGGVSHPALPGYYICCHGGTGAFGDGSYEEGRIFMGCTFGDPSTPYNPGGLPAVVCPARNDGESAAQVGLRNEIQQFQIDIIYLILGFAVSTQPARYTP